MAAKLKTPSFLLRKWKRGDEYALVKHANHEEVWQYLKDSFPHPYTINHAREWIKMVYNSQREIHMAIDFEGEPVGCIGIVLKEDVYRRSAEIGYWLSPEYWNKGIMSKAVKQMVSYAFETYNLNRIFARVFQGNEASVKVLKKANFVQEGTLRKAVFKDGIFMDEYVYGLLKSE